MNVETYPKLAALLAQDPSCERAFRLGQTMTQGRLAQSCPEMAERYLNACAVPDRCVIVLFLTFPVLDSMTGEQIEQQFGAAVRTLFTEVNTLHQGGGSDTPPSSAAETFLNVFYAWMQDTAKRAEAALQDIAETTRARAVQNRKTCYGHLLDEATPPARTKYN